MSRSEAHLSQSPLKANAMTFLVTVYSFTSSDCVYVFRNYLTTAKYIGLNMAENLITEQANVDSRTCTCNTTPKRLRKGTAEKRRHNLRNHALKVPCRGTKQCIIRIPQLQRIRIWTELWSLKDYDTRRAFMYQLIERKPVQGSNEQRAKKTFISYYFKNEDGYAHYQALELSNLEEDIR